MSILFRLREWLADRYSWMQYPVPRVQQVFVGRNEKPRTSMRAGLSLWAAFELAIFSMIGLMAGLALLALCCVAIYCVI